MKKLWNFLAKPQNLALLVAFAGALAFIWTEMVKPALTGPAPPPPARLSVEPAIPATVVTGNAVADDGGTAVISTGNGSITVNKEARDDR